MNYVIQGTYFLSFFILKNIWLSWWNLIFQWNIFLWNIFPRILLSMQFYWSDLVFINVFLINSQNTISTEVWDLEYFEPTYLGFKHHCVDKSIALHEYITACLMLPYLINIHRYQVYMNWIPQFELFNFLKWQMFIAYITFFYCWHILNGLTNISTCTTRTLQ